MTQLNNKVYKIVFVMFSDAFNYGNKKDFLDKIKSIPAFLDAQGIILPVPDNAPPNIPSMILSKNNFFDFRFSRNRIDCAFFQNLERENVLSAISDLYSKLHVNIKNIGFVVSVLIDGMLDDVSNNYLPLIFNDKIVDICNIKKSEEFTLRNLFKKKLLIDKVEITANFSSIFNLVKVNNMKRISVDFDVNTFPSENLNIDESFISLFVSEVFQEKNTFIEDLISQVLNNDNR